MSTLKMTLSLILQMSWLEVKESNVLAVELKVLHLDALRRVAEKASISCCHTSIFNFTRIAS
jgi:hypothetical protein